MANSADPDQTASSLILVYTVCLGMYVQIFRVSMVYKKQPKTSKVIHDFISCTSN